MPPRPLCQKDSLDDDLYDHYGDDDDVGDYDYGGDVEKVCSEAGVKHKGEAEVDRILGVYRVVQSCFLIGGIVVKVTCRVIHLLDINWTLDSLLFTNKSWLKCENGEEMLIHHTSNCL